MQNSLVELSEHFPHGFVWLQADGLVLHANTAALLRTGWHAGHGLQDPELLASASAVIRHGRSRALTVSAGGQRIGARLLPGPAGDDAMLLFAAEGAEEPLLTPGQWMQTLDSGLRRPLKSANEALLMMRESGDDPHAAQALADEVERLLQALRRLVDLATVWGGAALQGDERLALWTLLQRAWGEIEPQALRRRVGARFRTEGTLAGQVMLYGNVRWLQRAIEEALAAALARCRPGSTLDVRHHQDGGRAQLVLHDCGALPEAGDTEAVGIILCRHVLALHGGVLRQEHEDDRVHWVLEFPTGAPHGANDPRLSVAQAQIYARDLAALMARARRPAASPSSQEDGDARHAG